MVLFGYKVKNAAGEILRGTLESESEEHAVSELKNKNYFILEISSPSVLSKELSFGSRFGFLNKIKPEKLVVFTRQFSILINSGMNLLESLAILSEQASDKKLKTVLANIIKDIEGGLLLSESLQKHPDIFSRLYISMVSAGEAGGVLDKTLNDLASFLEKENEIRLKIKNKTAYPKFVTGFAVVVIIALIIFIVPSFKDAYEGLGAKLPLMTRGVLLVSQLFKTVWFYLAAAVIIIGSRYFLRHYIRTPKGKLLFDKLRLRIPGFGTIVKKIALSRFARTLGILIAAGVSILKSLDVVRGVSDNVIIDNAIEEIKASIRQGENIAVPLARYPIFPPMFIQMVNVGEKSGELDSILLKISEFYDNEVSHSIEVLMTILEPLMLVLVAALIAVVVIAMYLPMFKIYQYIS